MGVYTNIMTFAQVPSVWPSCYLAFLIQPLEREIVLVLKVVDPNDAEFIRLEGTIGIDKAVEQIGPAEILVVPVQIPQVRFAGFGEYRVFAGGSANELEQVYQFTVNAGAPPELG